MSATYEEIELAFDNGELDTTYPPSVYEAYCEYQGIDIDELREDYREIADKMMDSYVGHYESVREFFEEFIFEVNEIDPNNGPLQYMVFDYEASWNANYRHEFYEVDGHYFHMF